MMVSGGLQQVANRNDLKEIETMARYIMSHFPETCNNDYLLFLHYWEMVNHVNIPHYVWRDFVERASSPELISRIRRKIQYTDKDKKYAAREDVRKGRLEKAERFRSKFGSSKQGGKGLDEY